jgi:hypothetical protein
MKSLARVLVNLIFEVHTVGEPEFGLVGEVREAPRPPPNAGDVGL